jgi:integrase
MWLHYSAIQKTHESSGFISPTRHPQVRQIIEGAERKHAADPIDKKEPIRIDDLVKLYVPPPDQPSPAWLRDRAIVLLGFACARRRSEIAALQVTDVTFLARGMGVLIRKQKRDQTGRGHLIGVLRRPTLCPVRALEEWLAAAEIKEGAIFRRIDARGRPGPDALFPDKVWKILKQAAAQLGYDPTAFGAHSLRSGFATEAGRLGKSERAIMDQGHWESVEQAREYIRRGELFGDDNPTDILP